MASRNGPRAEGTDGFDFYHRQTVASHYQISVVNKSRLRLCIFMHFLLFLLMCAKLTEDLLDRLEIFVLEIEELEIPKPKNWEYTWTCSIIFCFVGLAAVRRNRSSSMGLFMIGTVVFGLCPILFAAGYYFTEMWTFISTRDSTQLEKWQGYPLAVLWYAFITVAFQIHVFTLYFANQLLSAWKSRGSKKAQ